MNELEAERAIELKPLSKADTPPRLLIASCTYERQNRGRRVL